MLVTQLPRVFLMKEKEHETRLADPEISFSPKAVLNFYANTYPLLTTANIEGPVISNDEVQYRFVATIGTKG
jgi:PRTRC genetic system protein C